MLATEKSLTLGLKQYAQAPINSDRTWMPRGKIKEH